MGHHLLILILTFWGLVGNFVFWWPTLMTYSVDLFCVFVRSLIITRVHVIRVCEMHTMDASCKNRLLTVLFRSDCIRIGLIESSASHNSWIQFSLTTMNCVGVDVTIKSEENYERLSGRWSLAFSGLGPLWLSSSMAENFTKHDLK